MQADRYLKVQQNKYLLKGAAKNLELASLHETGRRFYLIKYAVNRQVSFLSFK